MYFSNIWKYMSRKSLIVFAMSAASAGGALADEFPWFPEAYPPHLRNRLVEQDASLQLASLTNAERWYVDRLKRWDSEAAIRVCFFGGSQSLRKKIASIAVAWTQVPDTKVPLDFGDPNQPRLCKANEYNHIRVGYEYKGYWSLVGQDSIEQAPQGEQSMNLGRYNIVPPPEPTFTRLILHEFGHALGFHHEHQNPIGPCQTDFDWPVIETYLAGDPNFWDKETIDFNMRSRPAEGNPGLFDVKSIMLYAFRREFYRAGTRAECFTENNVALSDGDKNGLRELYPANVAQAELIKQVAFENFAKAIGQNNAIEPQKKAVALGRASQLVVPDKAMKLEYQWAADGKLPLNNDHMLATVPRAPRM